MRKFAVSCALTAAAALNGAASAGDLQGFGAAQCANITSLWDAADYDGRSQMLLAIGQWTFGYLSGRNADAPLGQRRELQALDSDDTALFIVTQCRDFPGVYVYDIVDIIYEAAPLMSAGA
jgi:hypothetical protein